MTKFCPFCGVELVDSAKFCKSCGKSIENIGEPQQTQDINQTSQFQVPVAEKDHNILIILGYVFAFLIPLIGLIISIYLLTRKDSSKGNRHGKYILIITIVVWILSFISIFW